MAEGKKKTRVFWSEDEVKLLKKLYKSNDAADIAKRLGRTASAVSGKVHRLKLKKIPVWSNQEEELLKKLYPSMTAQQVADKLGKTVFNIRQKAFQLHLKKRWLK